MRPQKSQAAAGDGDHRCCLPRQGWAGLKPVNGQLLAFCEKNILLNVILIYRISPKAGCVFQAASHEFSQRPGKAECEWEIDLSYVSGKVQYFLAGKCKFP